MNGRTDIPILYSNMRIDKDERFDGVTLVDCDCETKKTAEDCDSWWYIREWELYDLDGVPHWLSRHGHQISKSLIKLLSV